MKIGPVFARDGIWRNICERLYNTGKNLSDECAPYYPKSNNIIRRREDLIIKRVQSQCGVGVPVVRVTSEGGQIADIEPELVSWLRTLLSSSTMRNKFSIWCKNSSKLDIWKLFLIQFLAGEILVPTRSEIEIKKAKHGAELCKIFAKRSTNQKLFNLSPRTNMKLNLTGGGSGGGRGARGGGAGGKFLLKKIRS